MLFTEPCKQQRFCVWVTRAWMLQINLCQKCRSLLGFRAWLRTTLSQGSSLGGTKAARGIWKKAGDFHLNPLGCHGHCQSTGETYTLVQSPELGLLCEQPPAGWAAHSAHSKREGGKGQLLVPRQQNWDTPGEGDQETSEQFDFSHWLLFSIYQRIPKNGVLPGKKNEHKTECQNSDESQITHSHLAVIFHAAMVHLLRDWNCFDLSWANQYPKFGTSVIGSQERQQILCVVCCFSMLGAPAWAERCYQKQDVCYALQREKGRKCLIICPMNKSE